MDRVMGRPTKLTKELQAKVIEAVRAGNYIETAAAYAGISKPSLYDWMKRGNNQNKGIYRDFLNAIEKALADAEMRDVLIIGNAAKENWQAAAWRLERKFPDRWARKDKIQAEVNHSGGISTKIEIEQHYHVVQEIIEKDDKLKNRLLDAFAKPNSQALIGEDGLKIGEPMG